MNRQITRNNVPVCAKCPRCGHFFTAFYDIQYPEGTSLDEIKAYSNQALIDEPIIVMCPGNDCGLECKITIIDGEITTVDNFSMIERQRMVKRAVIFLIFFAFCVLILPHIVRWIGGLFYG